MNKFSKTSKTILDGYCTDGFYDEFFDQKSQLRSYAKPLKKHLDSLTPMQLKKRQKAAELALLHQGITFNVYGNSDGSEKVFPFDILPRVIPNNEWLRIERGLKQRVEALNLFINDVYNDKKILKDGIVPRDLITSSDSYLKQCEGVVPPRKIWIHITGTDLVRDHNGSFYVIEDNLRCPSGISYVLENRAVQKKIFPAAFAEMDVLPVSGYCEQLYRTLSYIGSQLSKEPNIVVLTPGIYNSAYFEHAYLAQQMGITLAEGKDLVIKDGFVGLKTTKGFEKVDVLYRRIDDTFLDPKEFNPNSLLGVPGIMDCFRKGNIALANAPGTGIADDKAVYAYVPKIIKYYLGEDPIIPNVPTYLCSDKNQRTNVLENIDKLVVKPVNGSGGYGMLIGNLATSSQKAEFSERILKTPRMYIAQPVLSLSRSPTIIGSHIEGRHVDLRPYILFGESVHVLSGGLTRVALVKGSLVVNSSQGGGSKDTWVLGSNRSSKEVLANA